MRWMPCTVLFEVLDGGMKSDRPCSVQYIILDLCNRAVRTPPFSAQTIVHVLLHMCCHNWIVLQMCCHSWIETLS